MALKNQKSSRTAARVAPGVKPFRCDLCINSGFGTLGAKQRHARENHNPHKYHCESCGTTFKRKYQVDHHKEQLHPERQASSTTDSSSKRGSRSPIGGNSPEETTASHLQNLRYSPFPQQQSTVHCPFPSSTRTLNGSEGYNPPSSGLSQRLEATSYAANACTAFRDDNRHLPMPSSREPSLTVQPSYSTTSLEDHFAQSDAALWQAPRSASRASLSNLSLSASALMNPTNQLAYPHQLGSSCDTNYDNPSYYSLSSEQRTTFRK